MNFCKYLLTLFCVISLLTNTYAQWDWNWDTISVNGKEFLSLPEPDLGFTYTEEKHRLQSVALDQFVDSLISRASNKEIEQREYRYIARNLSLLPSVKAQKYLLDHINVFMYSGDFSDNMEIVDRPCLLYMTKYSLDKKEFYQALFLTLNEPHLKIDLYWYQFLLSVSIMTDYDYQKLSNEESKFEENLKYILRQY